MAIDNVTILVGEPWDFTSNDGANKFVGEIIQHIKKGKEDRYLIKVKNPFELKNRFVKYVTTQTRNSPDNINIYYIPDKFINEFYDLKSIKDHLEFIAIGSFKN